MTRAATPLGLLFGGEFGAWIATAGQPVPPLWLFVHVPKTAGSSLAADLASHLAPYRSIHIDHLDQDRPAVERFDIAVDQALVAHAAAPFRFASGHVQYRHVERMRRAVPGMRLMTMLREPSARLVSDYLYQRSPMHPLAAEVRRRVPDFEAFLALKGPRNRMARHLLPAALIEAGDTAAAIAQIERDFAFVGVQERYALCFRALTAMLGRSRAPGESKRVNSAAAEERADIAARLKEPDFAARIAAANAMDVALWRYFAARWDAIAAPLEAWLNPAG